MTDSSSTNGNEHTGPKGIVVHAMHSFYDRANLPGGRSRRIAESSARSRPVHVYALLPERRRQPASDVVVERSVDSLRHRAVRFVGVRILRGRRRRRFAAKQFDAETARRVSRLPRETVSVLHIWNWLPRTVAAVRTRHPEAVILRDVSIAREHDFELGEDVRVEASLVDLFISPSGYATEQLSSWGISGDRIVEIPFGVDTERFVPRTTEARGGAAGAPVRFAFSGAVSERKGAPTLLHVWRRLALPEAELHLYGTVKPEVRDMLPLVDSVRAHGFVHVVEELPKNDVFVFPSRREGSSKAVYEALACGLPVITTPSSGSVVRHGVEGLIVPTDSEAELATAIRTLYTDRSLREKMSAAARARAEEFPWSRYAREVWHTYERVLNRSEA